MTNSGSRAARHRRTAHRTRLAEPVAPRPPGRKTSCVSLLSDGLTRDRLEASAVHRL